MNLSRYLHRFFRPLSCLLLSLILSGSIHAQQYIADYTVAREEVLRSIPEEYINMARDTFVIAYQHTSHGTHVSRGMYGLPDYRAGDQELFAISRNTAMEGKLLLLDETMEDYPPGAKDLSAGETSFVETTRNFLDAGENAAVNVVMWSWCDIAGHDVAVNYLPGMQTLIEEYGPGGSKVGTADGQREVPVTFIFMTGHANTNANVGEGRPKDLAKLITDYCKSNGYFCLDYYSIDTHDMLDNYWEDAGDNGNSESYGGNFYADYQDAQVLGDGYFENKSSPGGDVDYGEHTTQHITSNRKAFAMWWILARMAGWEGGASYLNAGIDHSDIALYPNPGSGMITLDAPGLHVKEIRLVDTMGKLVRAFRNQSFANEQIRLDISGMHPGYYLIHIKADDLSEYVAPLLIQ